MNFDEAIAVTEHLLKVLRTMKDAGKDQRQRGLALRKEIAFGCLRNIAHVLDGGSLPEELARMLLRKPN